MDDLTLVRELEADVPPLTDRARTDARTRLLHAIDRESRPGRAGSFPRRLVIRTAIAATATAAAATGAVVLTTGGEEKKSGTPQLASAGAVRLLHRAADRSRLDSANLPVPRNDQYLYTKEITTRTFLRSGKTQRFTDESWLSVDGSKPSRYSYFGRILDEPPLGEHQVRWPPTEYAKLRKWPTDPDELLAYLRLGASGSPEADQDAYLNACLLMRGPRVMPPGLQAAAFEAVAQLPGIELDHDAVDALGRRGIAVSHPGLHFAFIFDPRTYAYLGLRQEGSRGGKWVDGELRGGQKYTDVKGLVAVGVVDRIGRRPRAGTGR
ncbi:CU044_5270 family protein [Streptomyces sp. NPDC050164]|uniref:CU044_5270 family protein n=1 Tax=Streptomyces sp. NPDC050164 TaxID=3365605 RepID=UPI0037984C91